MGLGPSCYCQWSKGNKEICYGKGYHRKYYVKLYFIHTHINLYFI